jgi:hypothetical protein
VQRQALFLQLAGERAVRDATVERDRAGVAVDLHVRRQAGERNELRRVADVGERVARAQHPDLR